MKKNYILSFIAIVLVSLIVIKIILKSKKEKTTGAKPIAEAVMAECMIARDTMIDFAIKAVGHTRANERVELVSELSLRLVSIHFTEGSNVSKGDLLFQLDDSELQANLKKIQAKLDLATETAKRNKSLLASGGTSQQIYDESVSNQKVLEAEKELIIVSIGKTKILAPFSGTIGIRNVSEGAFLTPGTKLAVLEDLSRLKIDFTVAETYTGMIKKGERFSFRIEGFPQPFYAVVEAINPSVNRYSGNLEILALVQNPDPNLKAGISVSINLVSKSSVPAIYVPTQALIPSPGGYHIYVLKDGKANYNNIITGIRTSSMVEIVNGVVPGDSILLTGFMKIRPNSAVKIIKVW